MCAFNPMGCSVTSFKVPTPIELAHDYLWRVHQRDAGQGRDRDLQSLALRGRARRPRPRLRARRTSGRALRPDQRLRATARRRGHDHREVLPDLDGTSSASASRTASTTRRRAGSSGWAISRSGSSGTTTARRTRTCSEASTDQAPWYVIPADRNWFRNLAVADIVADTLNDLDPKYPPVEEDIPKGFVVS